MTTESVLTTARDGGGPDGDPLRWFVGVPFRPRTYANLLYLALAFPLGLVYFVTVVTGLSLGIGLSITLFGIPLLLLTLLTILFLGALEAKLATHLVGIDTPVPEALRADNPRSLVQAEDGLLDALKATVIAPTTWTTLVVVVAKFVYGILAFTVLVTAVTLTLVLVAAPFAYDHPDFVYTIGHHTVETLPEALAFAGVGVALGFISLHLLNALAVAGAVLNAALLGLESEFSESTD